MGYFKEKLTQTLLQPYEECISRNELERAISELTYWHPTADGRLEVGGAFEKTVYKIEDVWRLTRVLPFVTPRTNLAESSQDCISREAAIDVVVFECGEWTGLAKEINKQLMQLPPVTPSIKEWLSSFNTDSATECFTAVQELREKIKTN